MTNKSNKSKPEAKKTLIGMEDQTKMIVKNFLYISPLWLTPAF